MKQAGFSVVELLVAVAILAALVGAGLVAGRGSISKARTRTVAQTVMATLIAAREQAVSDGMPVAVSFPSNNGATPCSRSLYTRQGFHRPRLVSARTLAPDNSPVCVFLGSWDLASGSLTIDRPRLASESGSNAFRLQNWDDALSPDPTFVFLPNGEVVTNDLPIFEGAYHLLVSNGIEFSAPLPSGLPR